MSHPRNLIRLVALAAVTLVAAGACQPGARSGTGGGDRSTRVDAAGPAPTSDPGRRTRPTPAAPTPAAPARSQPAPRIGPEDAVKPVDEPGTTPPAKPATRETAPTSGTGGCPQGDRQREVETYLAKLGGFGKVTVDGRQSAADCAAIKKFQQRYGISPSSGRAGPTTADVGRRLVGTDTRACQAKSSGTTFCVDLTHQTAWVMRGGRVLLGPTVVRTGKAGYPTTAGWYFVNVRRTKEWSDPYKVWLPYWQHFNDGMGFHQTTTYLHDMSLGSHGCVNLLPGDAVRFYEAGKYNDPVHVFGRRPGT
jgi:hypothetical protein